MDQQLQHFQCSSRSSLPFLSCYDPIMEGAFPWGISQFGGNSFDQIDIEARYKKLHNIVRGSDIISHIRSFTLWPLIADLA